MARRDPEVLTEAPEGNLSFRRVSIDPALASEIGKTIYLSIQQSKGDRVGLSDTIEYWRDLSEMVTEERDEPWANAASISSGVAATAVIDVRSRLMAAVFVKAPYLVHGKTPDAAAGQEEVARFWNSWFYQQSVIKAHDDAIHLSILDGTSYIYVPWVKRVVQRSVVEMIPELDAQGEPVPDPKRPGKSKRKPHKSMARIVEQNGVFPESIELQDFLLIPASAQSVEDAMACTCRVWLTEADILAMVADGVFWKDAAEEILAYNQPGYDEHANLEHRSTYEMAGQINLSGGAVATLSDGTRQRGPFQFWRYHTKEFDLDEDGYYEENVGWIHDPSQILAGIGPYEYWHGRRPYVPVFAVMPRPNRAYGRGVPELTRCFDEEASAMDNQRLDLTDLLMGAPRYHTRNVDTKTQGNQWGPNADYEVDKPTDVGLLMQGYTIPMTSVQEQMMLEAKAARLVGTATPGQATMGSQKISAQQAKAWQTSQNVIIDLGAMQVRWAMKEVLEQAHFLMLQYGYLDDDDSDSAGAVSSGGQLLKPTFEVLGINGGRGYDLDVAGLTGGLDQSEEYQQVMTAYSLLRQDPLVSGDLGKWWYVVKMVLEKLQRPDIPKIIGDQKDAEVKQQQMEAAQQQKEDREFQLQIASHSKNPPPAGAGAQHGQPGANGHAPGGAPGVPGQPQPQPPQPTPHAAAPANV